MLSLRDRWRSLTRPTQYALLLAAGFVAVRLLLATQSGFGFHRGWNEGHYALTAVGFLDHPLVARYGERYVYDTTPLFPYLVAGAFAAFGTTEVVARLPTVLAAGGTLLATYALGREVYDARTGLVGAGVLAVLPYFALFGGRTQTDVTLLCLFTAALWAIVRGYERPDTRWLVAGGLLFAAAFTAKQPAVVLPAVVLAWLLWRHGVPDATLVRRTGVLVGASAGGLVPLAAWLAYNYSVAPGPFVAIWTEQLFERTAPFANVPLTLVIGVGLGVTPVVVALAGLRPLADARRDGLRRVVDAGLSNPLTWWLLVYGAFALYRTPPGHQYYVVGLLPPVALFAARGLNVVRDRAACLDREQWGTVAVALLLVSTLGGGVVLFELAGDFSAANGGGTRVAPDTADYLLAEAPDDATLVLPSGYSPPIRWYVRDRFRPERDTHTYLVRDFSRVELGRLRANSPGPVYLIAPNPSWAEVPVDGGERVHRSGPYDFTVMRVADALVDTDSKFRFYMETRRLDVYRYPATNASG